MANLPQFGIDLGGGFYLDSGGNVSTSAPADIPVYKVPGGGLPVNPSSVLSALKQLDLDGVWKMLPSLGDFKDITALTAIGLSEDLINMLAEAAEAAATLCQFVPLIGFAVSVVKALGIFGDGSRDNQLIDLINRRFNELELHEELLAKIQDLKDTADTVSNITADLVEVRKYVKLINSGAFVNPNDLYNRLQDVRSKVDDMYHKLRTLLGSPCAYVIRREPYIGFNYVYVQNALYCLPSGGPPQQAQLPAGGEGATFDYRPTLAAIVMGIQSFLVAIKSAAAEYRTSGEYQAELQDLAGLVAPHIETMRASCLARTIYHDGDKIWLQSDPPQAGFPFSHYLFPGIPVGAYDMREYTDAYLNSVANPAHPELRATMNMRWYPPAGTALGAYNKDWMQWTLSAAEAAAANKQSEQDYVKLLIRSGYMNLLQLLNLLRYLSTEPDHSETVKGEVLVTRTPQPSSSVTVTSKIPLSDPITATATRAPQKCEAITSISTQPIGRQVPVKYRVWLRTLAAPFDRYYSTSYVPADDPDFLKLAINADTRWLLTEHLIHDISPSPAKVSDESSPPDGLKLHAVTYDYYVPVRFSFPPLGAASEAAKARGAGLVGAGKVVSRGASAAQAAAGVALGDSGASSDAPPTGGSNVKLGPPGQNEVIVASAAGASAAGLTGAVDAKVPSTAQEREVNINTEVTLKYQLSWYADQLSIAFQNLPSDRNYTFYVVVEEHLPSGQWLQTPFRIDVVGQLTYVPQSFFDEEDAAKKRLAGILAKMAGYAISKQPEPGDPQSGVIRPGDLVSVPSMETMAQIAEKHSPELLRKAVAEYDKEQHKITRSAKAAHTGED
jgi:hypothetical protein